MQGALDWSMVLRLCCVLAVCLSVHAVASEGSLKAPAPHQAGEQVASRGPAAADHDDTDLGVQLQSLLGEGKEKGQFSAGARQAIINIVRQLMGTTQDKNTTSGGDEGALARCKRVLPGVPPGKMECVTGKKEWCASSPPLATGTPCPFLVIMTTQR